MSGGEKADHSWRESLARLREKPKPRPSHRQRYHSSENLFDIGREVSFESTIPNLPKVHAAIRKNSTSSKRRSVPPITSSSDFETYLDPTVPSGDRFEKYMKEMRYRKLQQRLFEERLQNEVVTKGGGWKVLPKISDSRLAEESSSRDSHMIYMPSITYGKWSPHQDSL